MSWKDWPSWLKGGLCVLIVLIIYALFVGLINWIFGGVTYFSEQSGRIILFIPILLIQLSSTLASDDIAAVLALWMITPLFYFLLGAIIGLIVGKFKK